MCRKSTLPFGIEHQSAGNECRGRCSVCISWGVSENMTGANVEKRLLPSSGSLVYSTKDTRGRLKASAQRKKTQHFFVEIYKSIIHKLTQHQYSWRPQTERSELLQTGKKCWQIKPHPVVLILTAAFPMWMVWWSDTFGGLTKLIFRPENLHQFNCHAHSCPWFWLAVSERSEGVELIRYYVSVGLDSSVFF